MDEDEDQIKEQSSVNQLYIIQTNKNQQAKKSQLNNFQFMSPENLSNVVKTFPTNDQQSNFKRIERKGTKRQKPLQVQFNEKNLNQSVSHKKMIEYFSSLHSMKQTDVLSKHLWQNLNDKVKEEIESEKGKGIINGENEQNLNRKPQIKKFLPSVIRKRCE